MRTTKPRTSKYYLAKAQARDDPPVEPDTPLEDIDLQPKDLLNDDDNYALQDEHVNKLMKYVWSGVLLPLTESAFKLRIGVDGWDKQLDSHIETLLGNYKVVEAHSKTFKDVTFPSIVAIAAQIKDYADTVGGNSDDSYYVALLNTCIELDDELKKVPRDEDKIAELTELINEIVDAQLKQIEDLHEAAAKVVTDLRTYEGQTVDDHSALSTTKGGLDKILSGSDGAIETLERELKDKKKELDEKSEEYEKDKTIAISAVSYVWIWPFGTIPAAVVMGVYGDKARKMKTAMEDLENYIDETEEKLRRDKKIMADATLIVTDVNTMIDLASGAIDTIQRMMGTWDSIANDLKAIAKFVEEREAKGSKVFRELNQKNIISKWNTLSKSIGEYQKVAYISAPPIQTVAQWNPPKPS